ncbi:hypothetical protein P7C70_g9346, partial [Phenoliferia sp. Uapishka_3]
MKTLIPAVRSTKRLHIESDVSRHPDDEEEMDVGVADLIRAASTLESLTISTRFHAEIDSAILTLSSLEELFDSSRGTYEQKWYRLWHIPSSLRRYNMMVEGDKKETASGEEALSDFLIRVKGCLRNLVEVGGTGLRDEDKHRLGVEKMRTRMEVWAARPEVRFT